MRPETDDPTGDWTAPGVYTVAPGVHRIPLPLPNDGLRAVNVYALDDGGGLTLVDSGWALAEARARLGAALAALGAGLGDVRRFLVTHLHRDHYTQAVALRGEFGHRVYLGRREEPSLRRVADPAWHPLSHQLAALRACGAEQVAERFAEAHPASGRALWQAPDTWLEDGDRVELAGTTLHVVSTPGHTQGHVVYADPGAGLLFAGDHVLPHITPSIGFEPVPVHDPLGDYLRSLRSTRSRPDLRLLPAHGPVADSVHARVDQLLEHHDQRLGATLDTVAAGATTAFAAASALTWTRRGRRLDELDPFNQMLAVLETAAHLRVLALQGRVCERDDAGVTVYHPSPPVPPG